MVTWAARAAVDLGCPVVAAMTFGPSGGAGFAEFAEVWAVGVVGATAKSRTLVIVLMMLAAATEVWVMMRVAVEVVEVELAAFPEMSEPRCHLHPSRTTLVGDYDVAMTLQANLLALMKLMSVMR